MPTDNLILQQAAKENASKKEATAVPTTSAATPVANSKLEDIQAALGASTARITQSIKALEDSAKQTKTATQVIEASAKDVASSAVISKRAQLDADLKAQNATIDSFQASGGREIQSALMRQLQEDNVRVDKLLNEKQDIVDDEFTGIQIIDGIINAFRSFQTDLEIQAATDQRAATERQISNITAATESFARANALTRKTLNEGVIEANLKAIEAESKIKSAELTISNLQTNATAMNNLMRLDSANVSNLIQTYRLENEAEEREFKRERMSFEREQMRFAREKWKVELPAAKVALERAALELEDAKVLTPERRAALEANYRAATKRYNDAVALDEQLSESVQKGQAILGLPVEDSQTLLFKLENPKTAAAYIKLQEIGGSTDGNMGHTPFEAQSNRKLIDPEGRAKATKATRLLDAISVKQAEKYATLPGGVPSNPAQLESDFNSTAKEVTDALASNIANGDQSNPYQAPPMSVLEQAKAVQETVFYQKVLKPMQMKETNPQTIVDAAINGILAKTITPEEAAEGIETIFAKAAALNNEQGGGFRRVGLPNQISYNVRIDRDPTLFEVLKGAAVSSVPTTLLGKVLKLPDEATTEQVEEQLFGATWFDVDLMDQTRVKNLLVQLMAQTPPPKTTEQNQ